MTSNIVRANSISSIFADDINAHYAHRDLKTLELTVNAEVHNLYNWLNSNKLSLNFINSNYVILHPYQKKINCEPQVNVFENESNNIMEDPYSLCCKQNK